MTPSPSEPSLADVAGWMLDHVEWLRHHRAGPEAVEEITSVITSAKRLVDRPPARWYAGRCPCGTDLEPITGATTISCPGCGTAYDARTRREELLDIAADQLATATELARTVTSLGGVTCTPSMVRNLAARGRLTVGGHDRTERPMYRVGDLLDVLAAREERSA